MLSSEYLEKERKKYAIYVLQNRALPSIADGMKIACRRLLWTARNGQKYKTAALSGATMPLHPHAAADGVVNTNTGEFLNNIPLFEGIGAFGSRLAPNSAASPRYTSVKVSKFTQDVVFKDIELIEMIDNYDQTLKEPKNYFPLVPTVLLNQSDGIGVGFASTILPRSLLDIIKSQIQYLNGKRITPVLPEFTPIRSKAIEKIIENDTPKYIFKSSFIRLNSFEIHVTELQYGTTYDKFINTLNKLEESGFIKDYIDSSSEKIDIIVKFPRGYLNKVDDEIVLKKIGLISRVSENLTVLDFQGDKVITPDYETIIRDFCDYRVKIYDARYRRLLGLLQADIQKYKDIILAIEKKVGLQSVKMADRNELKEFLKKIGIVNLDYIADLSVYRFTIKEKEKVELKLKDALVQEAEYLDILADDAKQVEIYVLELKEILSNYKKGKYGSIN